MAAAFLLATARAKNARATITQAYGSSRSRAPPIGSSLFIDIVYTFKYRVLVDVAFNLQGIDFEWSRRKALTNFKKHGVSFEEAAEAFFDPFYQHGDASVPGEEREFILGYSTRERLLLVVHIERAGRFRIISARPATREERKLYEET